MKCRDARELINSYIDNGLDPEKDHILMEHINVCHKCNEELKFLLEYRKTVSKIKPVKAPASFLHELNKRIELEKRSTFRRLYFDAVSAWRRFTFPLEAVGVIAVALLIFFLYTPLFHGVKKMTTWQEEQTVTETKSKSINEQIIEKRKLLPPAAGKKESRESLSLSSEKITAEYDQAGDGEFREEEEKAPAYTEDSIAGMSKEAEERSMYDSDSDKSTTDVFRSESAKKDEAPREMKKKAVSANKISPPSPDTPGRIITESGGVIKAKRQINDSAVKYTVKIEKTKLSTLSEKLKRNYNASYKITGSTGSTLTVEFVITE